MALRWIGTRCRPIDISDAVGVPDRVRENPRTAGGEFDIQAGAGRNSPPRGWRTVPGPTASRVFRGTHVFRGADSRNWG